VVAQMVLTECSKCGGGIPDTMDRCLQCGTKRPDFQRRNCFKSIGSVVLGLVLIVGCFGIGVVLYRANGWTWTRDIPQAQLIACAGGVLAGFRLVVWGREDYRTHGRSRRGASTD